MTIMEILRDEILTRLKAKTEYVGDCWLYKGYSRSGIYGSMQVFTKRLDVHRLSASLFLNLDIDDWKIQANHKSICPNKNCWNPDHLYVGTQKDNMLDRRGKKHMIRK